MCLRGMRLAVVLALGASADVEPPWAALPWLCLAAALLQVEAEANRLVVLGPRGEALGRVLLHEALAAPFAVAAALSASLAVAAAGSTTLILLAPLLTAKLVFSGLEAALKPADRGRLVWPGGCRDSGAPSVREGV